MTGIAKVFVAVLCAALAMGQSGGVLIRSCSDAFCAQNCVTTQVPPQKCLNGTTISCRTDSAMCLMATEYSDGNCTTSSGLTAAVCESCYMYNDDYHVLRGCSTNNLAIHYHCDSTCTRCKHSRPIALRQCVVSPINGRFYTVTNIYPCGSVVSFRRYDNDQCSGSSSVARVPDARCETSPQGGSTLSVCM